MSALEENEIAAVIVVTCNYNGGFADAVIVDIADGDHVYLVIHMYSNLIFSPILFYKGIQYLRAVLQTIL